MSSFALARAIVRAAARLVPRWQRDDWRREWQAELDHHAREASASRVSLVTRSTGAVADAAVLRTHAMHWDLLWNDARFAWRNAVQRPAFTALVVLTLALGIGVNSAVFALLDGVLLHPLPYRDPSRLVFMWQTLPRLNVAEVEATPFDYTAWQGLQTIPDIAMLQFGSFTVTGRSDPERLRGARVTASLMSTLGIAPAIGRAFTAAEDFDDAPAVAIVSDGVWRRRFGGDPAAIGRAIEVDGVPRTIVGVMPRGALLPGRDPADSDLWLPMRMNPAERIGDQSHSYTFVGRLAAETTLVRASAEFEARAARLAAERRSHTGIGGRIVPIAEQATRGIKPTLVLAAGAVALLLLVAAANASTLLIARASTRRAELAVRAALGATRGRLLSLSVAEGVTYSCLAALAGIVLGTWTLRLLLALFGGSVPQASPIDVGARAALFSAGLAVMLGVVFGVVTAFHPADRLAESLRGAARFTASAAAGRARAALVVGQIAIAVLLLAGAGLMLSSVAKLSRVGPGFAPDHLLTFRVALTGTRYETDAARVSFVSDLLGRLASAPDTRSAAVTSVTPFGGMRNANGVVIEGRAVAADELPIVIDQRYVSPEYFQTMQIPLVAGRALTARDDRLAEQAIVVNRTMARRYFPEGAVDHRVKFPGGSRGNIWFRIVGVVDDVRHISLNRDPVPEMYHAIAQIAIPTFTVVVRTSGEPAAMTSTARAAMAAVDAGLPMYEVVTMEDRIAASFAQTRGTMLVLLATALLAAALAAVAIYGSIWYAVVQRRREIGIRMALGASRASVFRGIVGAALARAAAGAAAGAIAAMAGGQLLQTMLFDTRPTDPATYGAVIAGVLGLTALASFVPARRAMSVDPMTALRNE